MKSESEKVPEWYKIACAMLDDGRYTGEVLDCLPYALEMSLKESKARWRSEKHTSNLIDNSTMEKYAVSRKF